MYDALGRRVTKTYKGRSTHWLWDTNKPLHEWRTLSLDGENTDDVITWLFEEDSFSPIGKLQSTIRQSILSDHLGTPLEMVDQAGQRTWSAQTTAYGRVRLEQGTRTECPFRFQGQYEDTETGLYYNRFRYYAPEEGMYVSQDPIGLRGGLEHYSYVSDPNVWIDPLGLVRILTSGKIKISAYPGPKVGGVEHTPIHAHIEDGKVKTRVLMEDYQKNGKKIGSIGDVYPGDPEMTKDMKKVVEGALDDLSNKTRSVFDTGVIPCPK